MWEIIFSACFVQRGKIKLYSISMPEDFKKTPADNIINILTISGYVENLPIKWKQLATLGPCALLLSGLYPLSPLNWSVRRKGSKEPGLYVWQ